MERNYAEEAFTLIIQKMQEKGIEVIDADKVDTSHTNCRWFKTTSASAEPIPISFRKDDKIFTLEVNGSESCTYIADDDKSIEFVSDAFTGPSFSETYSDYIANDEELEKAIENGDFSENYACWIDAWMVKDEMTTVSKPTFETIFEAMEYIYENVDNKDAFSEIER